MILIKILLIGIIILTGAILLNTVATKLSIKTWYDFIQNPGDTNLLAYIWLFGIYPLCLGLVAYLAHKLLAF